MALLNQCWYWTMVNIVLWLFWWSILLLSRAIDCLTDFSFLVHDYPFFWIYPHYEPLTILKHRLPNSRGYQTYMFPICGWWAHFTNSSHILPTSMEIRYHQEYIVQVQAMLSKSINYPANDPLISSTRIRPRITNDLTQWNEHGIFLGEYHAWGAVPFVRSDVTT